MLNQLIVSELELQPMTTSDKAWVWAGYNYTDDGCTLEKLAIRFKNCETAQTFYKIVQDIIGKLQAIEVNKTKDESSSGDQEFIPSTVQNIEVGNVHESNQSNDGEDLYEYDEDEENDEDDDDDDDGR